MKIDNTICFLAMCRIKTFPLGGTHYQNAPTNINNRKIPFQCLRKLLNAALTAWLAWIVQANNRCRAGHGDSASPTRHCVIFAATYANAYILAFK